MVYSNSTMSWILGDENSTSLVEDNTMDNDSTTTLGPTPTGPAVNNWIYASYFFVPFLLVFGVFGNCLTIRVMLTPSFKNMVASALLIALAISDMTVVCMVPFNRMFVRKLLGVDIRSLTPAGCKAFYWAFRVAKMSSSWIIMLISCERFVAVWLPLHAKRINTKQNALIAIGVVYGVLGVYTGYWCSWADQMVGGTCIPNFPDPNHLLRGQVFLVLGLSFYAFLPSSVLCVLNSLVVYKLVALRRLKEATWSSSEQSKHTQSVKTTVMLLGITVAFIILVNPVSVAHVLSFARGQNIFETTDPGMVFLRELSTIMEQLNNSINFILYMLFSRRFRDRVRELFMIVLVQWFGCGRGRLQVWPAMDTVMEMTGNSRTPGVSNNKHNGPASSGINSGSSRGGRNRNGNRIVPSKDPVSYPHTMQSMLVVDS